MVIGIEHRQSVDMWTCGGGSGCSLTCLVQQYAGAVNSSPTKHLGESGNDNGCYTCGFIASKH